jgi:hypothetical protein
VSLFLFDEIRASLGVQAGAEHAAECVHAAADATSRLSNGD